MRLLLDTCTFLWLAMGASELSGDALVLCRDPSNDLFLSAVSAWEIAIKHSLGGLTLSEKPHQFVPRYRERHAIDALSLSEDAVLRLGALPLQHKDPFDRILVCQAIAEEMTILTPDELIRQYPIRTIW